MNVFRWCGLTALVLVVIVGCGPRRPQESMSAGHATIGASEAIRDVATFLAQEFRGANANAWIDIFVDSDQALIDSLVNKRAEEIFLDRTLTPAETLAFHNSKQKLWTYAVAYYPIYLLVAKDNPVVAIDSAALRGVLTGTIDNWRQLGGPDEAVNVYLSSPGDGPWVSLFSYFGRLDSVQAAVCATSKAMLDSARKDAGALLVYAKPLDDLSLYKALRFDWGGGLTISPNVKTILDTPGYPFRLDITYVTTHNKADVAAGYLTFAVGNLGQRRLMDALRYRPAAVPVRMVKLK